MCRERAVDARHRTGARDRALVDLGIQRRLVFGLIDPFHRSHIFAVVGRHDGDVGGCRNQRSSLREAMGYPRLSPVDETAAAFGSR
jgi:hypothetical protein